jgi:F-type H+-transporting ATPase subunit alpha
MKKVAGQLKLDMAQYRELAAFAQFGTSELDKATKAQIDRGERITEVFKQLQYIPMSVGKQVTILYAANKGYIDDVPVKSVHDFESKLLTFVENQHADIINEINDKGLLTEELEKKLDDAITNFKRTFAA